MIVLFLQAELDNVNCVLNDVEGKSIKAAKDFTAVESQLQDVQVYSDLYVELSYDLLEL